MRWCCCLTIWCKTMVTSCDVVVDNLLCPNEFQRIEMAFWGGGGGDSLLGLQTKEKVQEDRATCPPGMGRQKYAQNIGFPTSETSFSHMS